MDFVCQSGMLSYNAFDVLLSSQREIEGVADSKGKVSA